MSILKYVIASVLSLASPEEGWVAVPKPVKPQEQGEERESEIWVLFAKNLGDEQFIVRFPDDPSYRSYESGEFEVSSEKMGEYFSLTVRKLEAGAGKRGDSLQFQEGKWIHEHIAQSSHYEYQFRTVSNQEKSPNHKDFVNSFGFFS